MRSSRMSLFAFLLVAGLFALPAITQAAAIPFFGPIIPQEGTQAVCAAGWGMLITVINNIIAFSITIAIVFIAPLMVAYAGFLFVVNPVNSGGISKAKGILTNTIVGIVIALAGWMIVDAIMVVLYNPSAVSGTTRLTAWSQLITSGGLGPCVDLRGSVPPTVAPPAVGVVPPSVAPASEAAVRQRLTSAGVQINSQACVPYDSNGVLGRCTNVGSMLPSTVEQIISIKSACGCIVTVTGGSESGHAQGNLSHGAGYKVDLRRSVALDNYLRSMTSIGNRVGDSSGPAYTDRCNQNQYVEESTHWDIRINSACVPPK